MMKVENGTLMILLALVLLVKELQLQRKMTDENKGKSYKWVSLTLGLVPPYWSLTGNRFDHDWQL